MSLAELSPIDRLLAGFVAAAAKFAQDIHRNNVASVLYSVEMAIHLGNPALDELERICAEYRDSMMSQAYDYLAEIRRGTQEDL